MRLGFPPLENGNCEPGSMRPPCGRGLPLQSVVLSGYPTHTNGWAARSQKPRGRGGGGVPWVPGPVLDADDSGQRDTRTSAVARNAEHRSANRHDPRIWHRCDRGCWYPTNPALQSVRLFSADCGPRSGRGRRQARFPEDEVRSRVGARLQAGCAGRAWEPSARWRASGTPPPPRAELAPSQRHLALHPELPQAGVEWAVGPQGCLGSASA